LDGHGPHYTKHGAQPSVTKNAVCPRGEYTSLLQDRAAEAEIILLEAIAEAQEQDYFWNLVGMYVDLAAARLAQGRPADARATERQAIALAEQDGDPAENGWALKELGRAESALDNHAETTTYLRKALETHRQAKQRHMAARAQGYLGQALLRAGQFQQGINELTEAIAILEALQLNREADQFRKLLPPNLGLRGEHEHA